MSALLHISDPHFGTEREPVVDALLRFAARLQPERIILSGDVTQRARRAQFAAARAFVEALPAPVMVIPGNHDIPLFDLWTRLSAPYRHFRRAFGHDLEPCWESDEWQVQAINTTRWYRHKDGEVSRHQIRRVAERLARAHSGQLRLVVTHQPIQVTREHDLANRLHGHAQAAQAWAEAGVDLLLGGHIHLPYVTPLVPGATGRPYVVQAGTAVSHRVRGDIPNSVNVLRRMPGERQCEVERWDFRHDTQQFELFEARALALAAGRAA